MSQITYTADDLTLVSYYQYTADHQRKLWTEDSQTIDFVVADLPEHATVRRAVLNLDVGDAGGARVTTATIYNEDAKPYFGQTAAFRVNVRSNRAVQITVTFKTYPSIHDGAMHVQRWFLTNISLVITYDTEGEGGAEDYPPMVLVPKKTVKLFSPTETNFLGNGLCILSPTSCVVSEEAGGSYELTMEHPIDDAGKWELLQEDYIIEAPIPPMYIPEVTMPPWEIWVTNKETDFYTVLPSWTKSKSPYQAIYDNPSAYNWVSGRSYVAGNCVVYPSTGERGIYQARLDVSQSLIAPPEAPAIWSRVGGMDANGRPTDGGQGQFNPGKIYETFASGTQVYKMTDYSADWMQVRSLRGVIGYVKRSDVEPQGSSVQVTEPARTRYTQLFRIYEVGSEEDTHLISVRARHISYDLSKNRLYDVQVEECEPATVIGIIQGSLLNDDDREMRWADMTESASRKILCNITEPLIKGKWSFQNPIQALLDPEEGLAGKARAKVLRDNQDLFILDNTRPMRGVTIRYGVNLRGVKWTRSTADVITRIMPRAKNSDDSYLYLDELFIDSENIGAFAVISTEILDSEYSVGQKIKHLDGTESQPLSTADVAERMRAEAEDRFYVDHCDSVQVSLDVEFVLLGDTEEFRQYRNLQHLQIYDLVTIDTGPTRMRTQAQVSGYEWDCLLGRYNSISIGQVYRQSRRGLPGYRLSSGAITYSKLAPDLISYIKGE